jgi:hypothetical protein
MMLMGSHAAVCAFFTQLDKPTDICWHPQSAADSLLPAMQMPLPVNPLERQRNMTGSSNFEAYFRMSGTVTQYRGLVDV